MRTQTHIHTEERGLEMLIQTHRQGGCKSSPYCEFSMLAVLCSGEPLYSIELPSILAMALSRHVQGAPTGT